MTPLSLLEVRGLCDAATPGPWTIDVGICQDPDGDDVDDYAFARGPRVQRQRGEAWSGPWRKQADDNAAFIAASREIVPQLLSLVEEQAKALQDISDIRDSIVGCQGFNFSEHAYPLVAVLDRVGFKGVGHKIASKNLGTLIDQINAAEAEIKRLRKALQSALNVWCPRHPRGDGADGETYELCQAALSPAGQP